MRRESFILYGEDAYDYCWNQSHPGGSEVNAPRHCIDVSPICHPLSPGNCEILIEDISKIRACLDIVEAHVKRREGRT